MRCVAATTSRPVPVALRAYVADITSALTGAHQPHAMYRHSHDNGRTYHQHDGWHMMGMGPTGFGHDTERFPIYDEVTLTSECERCGKSVPLGDDLCPKCHDQDVTAEWAAEDRADDRRRRLT